MILPVRCVGMYIRRTTIKSRRNGEPYYTYRLVESIRLDGKVRQRTLLNLGRHFDVAREQWAPLAQRIEQLTSRQGNLFPSELDGNLEVEAQRYSALVIQAKSRLGDGFFSDKPDFQTVDVNSLAMVRPRSIGVEHVGLEALRKIGLDKKLEQIGFNTPQCAAAIGTIIARMTAPGSELSTHSWLKENSGLGELIDFDFETLNLKQLYRIAARLLKHKEDLEDFLYSSERSLFDFDEVITLYDLTNTYFEGTGESNDNAARGRSKEKRSDCPLVTLALVLDGSGFPKKSEIFTGNASEPKTLSKMLGKLVDKDASKTPTVVIDAGIATKENIDWLVDNHYHYIAVSRKRHREFNENEAVLIKEDGEMRIQAQRVLNPDTGEVELYCHSSQREKKDQGIEELLAKRLETELEKLAEGLHKKGTVKKYEKVLERIGRIKQKYSRAAQHYDVTVTPNENNTQAVAIHWKRKNTIKDTHPGVYCLRTNQNQWSEATLWNTYTMLTDLESVFRSLKSELGLRPVFHYTTDQVSAHLFISVLGYHLVHMIRVQLKNCDIHLSWESLRKKLQGQNRTTVELKRKDGKMLHIRKASRPEPRHQVIYDALGIPDMPGKTVKTVM
jgi:transposase